MLVVLNACNNDELEALTLQKNTTKTRYLKIKKPIKNKLEHYFDSIGLVKITDVNANIKCKLAYADTANFLKINLYNKLKYAYLPIEVAQNLSKAQNYLDSNYKNYLLIIYDAARPLSIQKIMWDSLKLPNHKKYGYVAPPNYQSLHNYGCAVDVGLDSNGVELDLGTKFDTFDSLSAPAYEWLFLKSKKLLCYYRVSPYILLALAILIIDIIEARV